jgi:hypothetical protein
MQPTSNIQICQPGYDVRNCPDYAYLFNGAWPNLAIVKEMTVALTGSAQTIPHNLGFPPLAMGWYTQGGKSWGRMAGSDLEVDDTNLYIFSEVSTGNVTLRWYNIDVSKEASYPLPQSSQAKLPYNNQFGAKLVKTGRAITSTNLNDFILHTRAQSPALLEVATEGGKYHIQSNARHYWPYGNIETWDLLVYPLQTPFIPWYVGAFGDGGDAYSLAGGSDIYFDSTTNSLVMNITATVQGSLIILRDPLFYPNVVQAIY